MVGYTHLTIKLYWCNMNVNSIFLNAKLNGGDVVKRHQVVIRITKKLDTDIEKAAQAKGLTKASWVRQLIIETLAGIVNG